MPLVGLGTYQIPKDACADTVYNAIKLGYRMLDGACDYGNEAECGKGVARAIAEGIVTRSDLFITSKLWNTFHEAPRVEPIARRQLSDWRIDYFDLYLIHFPIALQYVDPEERYPPKSSSPPSNATTQETWQAMERLVGIGLARNIGLANFNAQLILDILRYAHIKPAALQVEIHPYLPQLGLTKFAQENSIAVTGYWSFGPGSAQERDMATLEEPPPPLFENPVVKGIAARHEVSVAKVLLKWNVQRGVAVIPKSNNPGRLAQNLELWDFELDEREVGKISKLNKGLRFNNPVHYGLNQPIHV